MNWTFLIGIGTIVLAVVAGYQAWLLRNSTMADLTLKLDERFNDKLLRKRKKAAQSLKNRPAEHDADIEDVLDFFETLGFLIRHRALDKKVVWHTFFYWIHGYWKFTRGFVANQQSTSPARYAEIEYLHEKTLKIEVKERGPLVEDEWNDFLEMEAAE
jgi:hypothetical protein